MNTAKWIIGIIVSAVLAYIIYDQKITGTEEAENQPDLQEKSGIEVKKRYDDKGNLKSEAQYVNGMKHGLAKNYYASGAIHSEIHYENNVKEGNSTWFYENGKPYRITPFKNGKKEGIQKKYYKSGKLMAEIPYKKGQLIEGTKEFSESGNLLESSSEIVVNHKHAIKVNDSYSIEIQINKNSKINKCYCITDKGLKLTATNIIESTAKFDIPDVTKNKLRSVAIYAQTKTKMANPILLKRNVQLASH